MAGRGRPRSGAFNDGDTEFGRQDDIFVERLAAGFDTYTDSLGRNARQKRDSARATEDLRRAEDRLQGGTRAAPASASNTVAQTERQAKAYQELANQLGRVNENAQKAAKSLTGEVLLFSGFRDAALKQEIERAGGRVVSQFSGKVTNVLSRQRYRDPSRDTGKVQAARQAGIPIQTIEQFRNQFLDVVEKTQRAAKQDIDSLQGEVDALRASLQGERNALATRPRTRTGQAAQTTGRTRARSRAPVAPEIGRRVNELTEKINLAEQDLQREKRFLREDLDNQAISDREYRSGLVDVIRDAENYVNRITSEIADLRRQEAATRRAPQTPTAAAATSQQRPRAQAARSSRRRDPITNEIAEIAQEAGEQARMAEQAYTDFLADSGGHGGESLDDLLDESAQALEAARQTMARIERESSQNTARARRRPRVSGRAVATGAAAAAGIAGAAVGIPGVEELLGNIGGLEATIGQIVGGAGVAGASIGGFGGGGDFARQAQLDNLSEMVTRTTDDLQTDRQRIEQELSQRRISEQEFAQNLRDAVDEALPAREKAQEYLDSLSEIGDEEEALLSAVSELADAITGIRSTLSAQESAASASTAADDLEAAADAILNAFDASRVSTDQLEGVIEGALERRDKLQFVIDDIVSDINSGAGNADELRTRHAKLVNDLNEANAKIGSLEQARETLRQGGYADISSLVDETPAASTTSRAPVAGPPPTETADTGDAARIEAKQTELRNLAAKRNTPEWNENREARYRRLLDDLGLPPPSPRTVAAEPEVVSSQPTREPIIVGPSTLGQEDLFGGVTRVVQPGEKTPEQEIQEVRTKIRNAQQSAELYEGSGAPGRAEEQRRMVENLEASLQRLQQAATTGRRTGARTEVPGLPPLELLNTYDELRGDELRRREEEFSAGGEPRGRLSSLVSRRRRQELATARQVRESERAHLQVLRQEADFATSETQLITRRGQQREAEHAERVREHTELLAGIDEGRGNLDRLRGAAEVTRNEIAELAGARQGRIFGRGNRRRSSELRSELERREEAIAIQEEALQALQDQEREVREARRQAAVSQLRSAQEAEGREGQRGTAPQRLLELGELQQVEQLRRSGRPVFQASDLRQEERDQARLGALRLVRQRELEDRRRLRDLADAEIAELTRLEERERQRLVAETAIAQISEQVSEQRAAAERAAQAVGLPEDLPGGAVASSSGSDVGEADRQARQQLLRRAQGITRLDEERARREQDRREGRVAAQPGQQGAQQPSRGQLLRQRLAQAQQGSRTYDLTRIAADIFSEEEKLAEAQARQLGGLLFQERREVESQIRTSNQRLSELRDRQLEALLADPAQFAQPEAEQPAAQQRSGFLRNLFRRRAQAAQAGPAAQQAGAGGPADAERTDLAALLAELTGSLRGVESEQHRRSSEIRVLERFLDDFQDAELGPEQERARDIREQRQGQLQEIGQQAEQIRQRISAVRARQDEEVASVIREAEALAAQPVATAEAREVLAQQTEAVTAAFTARSEIFQGLSESAEDYTRIKGQVGDLEGVLQTLERRTEVASLTAERQRLENQRATISSEILTGMPEQTQSSLITDLDEIERSVRRVQERIAAYERGEEEQEEPSFLGGIRARIASGVSSVQEQREAVSRAPQARQFATTQQQRADAIYRELGERRSTVNRLKRDQDIAERNYREAESRVAPAEQAEREARSQFEQAQQALTPLEKTFQESTRELTEARGQLSATQESIDRLRTAETAERQARGPFEQATATRNRVRNTLDQATSRLRNVQNELQKSRANVDRLVRDVGNAADRAAQQQEALTEANKQAKEARDTAERLEGLARQAQREAASTGPSFGQGGDGNAILRQLANLLGAQRGAASEAAGPSDEDTLEGLRANLAGTTIPGVPTLTSELAPNRGRSTRDERIGAYRRRGAAVEQFRELSDPDQIQREARNILRLSEQAFPDVLDPAELFGALRTSLVEDLEEAVKAQAEAIQSHERGGLALEDVIDVDKYRDLAQQRLLAIDEEIGTTRQLQTLRAGLGRFRRPTLEDLRSLNDELERSTSLYNEAIGEFTDLNAPAAYLPKLNEILDLGLERRGTQARLQGRKPGEPSRNSLLADVRRAVVEQLRQVTDEQQAALTSPGGTSLPEFFDLSARRQQAEGRLEAIRQYEQLGMSSEGFFRRIRNSLPLVRRSREEQHRSTEELDSFRMTQELAGYQVTQSAEALQRYADTFSGLVILDDADAARARLQDFQRDATRVFENIAAAVNDTERDIGSFAGAAAPGTPGFARAAGLTGAAGAAFRGGAPIPPAEALRAAAAGGAQPQIVYVTSPQQAGLGAPAAAAAQPRGGGFTTGLLSGATGLEFLGVGSGQNPNSAIAGFFLAQLALRGLGGLGRLAAGGVGRIAEFSAAPAAPRLARQAGTGRLFDRQLREAEALRGGDLRGLREGVHFRQGDLDNELRGVTDPRERRFITQRFRERSADEYTSGFFARRGGARTALRRRGLVGLGVGAALHGGGLLHETLRDQYGSGLGSAGFGLLGTLPFGETAQAVLSQTLGRERTIELGNAIGEGLAQLTRFVRETFSAVLDERNYQLILANITGGLFVPPDPETRERAEEQRRRNEANDVGLLEGLRRPDVASPLAMTGADDLINLITDFLSRRERNQQATSFVEELTGADLRRQLQEEQDQKRYGQQLIDAFSSIGGGDFGQALNEPEAETPSARYERQQEEYSRGVREFQRRWGPGGTGPQAPTELEQQRLNFFDQIQQIFRQELSRERPAPDTSGFEGSLDIRGRGLLAAGETVLTDTGEGPLAQASRRTREGPSETDIGIAIAAQRYAELAASGTRAVVTELKDSIAQTLEGLSAARASVVTAPRGELSSRLDPGGQLGAGGAIDATNQLISRTEQAALQLAKNLERENLSERQVENIQGAARELSVATDAVRQILSEAREGRPTTALTLAATELRGTDPGAYGVVRIGDQAIRQDDTYADVVEAYIRRISQLQRDILGAGIRGALDIEVRENRYLASIGDDLRRRITQSEQEAQSAKLQIDQARPGAEALTPGEEIEQVLDQTLEGLRLQLRNLSVRGDLADPEQVQNIQAAIAALGPGGQMQGLIDELVRNEEALRDLEEELSREQRQEQERSQRRALGGELSDFAVSLQRSLRDLRNVDFLAGNQGAQALRQAAEGQRDQRFELERGRGTPGERARERRRLEADELAAAARRERADQERAIRRRIREAQEEQQQVLGQGQPNQVVEALRQSRDTILGAAEGRGVEAAPFAISDALDAEEARLSQMAQIVQAAGETAASAIEPILDTLQNFQAIRGAVGDEAVARAELDILLERRDVILDNIEANREALIAEGERTAALMQQADLWNSVETRGTFAIRSVLSEVTTGWDGVQRQWSETEHAFLDGIRRIGKAFIDEILQESFIGPVASQASGFITGILEGEGGGGLGGLLSRFGGGGEDAATTGLAAYGAAEFGELGDGASLAAQGTQAAAAATAAAAAGTTAAAAGATATAAGAATAATGTAATAAGSTAAASGATAAAAGASAAAAGAAAAATTAGAAAAGGFLGFALAEGGYVSGPGSDRSDSIPAFLSDGEFVVNAQSTRRYRPLLEALNANVEGFQAGGIVGQQSQGNALSRFEEAPTQGPLSAPAQPGGISISLTYNINSVDEGGVRVALRDAIPQIRNDVINAVRTTQVRDARRPSASQAAARSR